MTFSVVARCAETGTLGVAVASSSPAVAARCAFARAGVGAVASQNITDPALGPRALDLLALGASAQQAMDVLRGAAAMAFRQVLVVDAAGRSAIHSGAQTLGLWAEAAGTNVACGGNLLASREVPGAMMAAFLGASGDLGGRLLGAMRAGLAVGGEAGPIHSAGLCLVRDVPWPVADLRVDWTEECPVAALEALWARYRPQLDDYVMRALHPGGAPRYGVPGDP